MSRAVVTVSPETPVSEIVAQMERHGIKRVPVVRDGKLVGIVSRAICFSAWRAWPARSPSSANPTRSFAREFWTCRAASPGQVPVDASVPQGMVQQRGTIFNARTRDALRRPM
ncbi:MAG: hypothetical protein C3F17_02350 [Bradyrhizobiaceae bacterium]|nr:MAG: hypothetical protein C3F17_02350 [Bradyrhizobiaceae bacterium]